jgi:hypothetical protein
MERCLEHQTLLSARPTMPRKSPAILKTAASKAVYAKLLETIDPLGPFDVEEKKSSIHITRRRAFASVHPRAKGLVLNLVLDKPVRNKRVHKSEQVSANRYHVEFKLESPAEIDSQLGSWIADAYALTS